MFIPNSSGKWRTGRYSGPIGEEACPCQDRTTVFVEQASELHGYDERHVTAGGRDEETGTRSRTETGERLKEEKRKNQTQT